MFLSKNNILLAYLFALLCAVAFFSFNLYLINNGHFHEDAYIMFIYVENLVNGHGIAYYPNGPHAEGATDFLWMVLLSALTFLGLDVGLSAILLNTFGVLIISWIFASEIIKHKFNSNIIFYLIIPFIFLWVTQRALIAATGGFSVYLYLALLVIGIKCLLERKYIQFTPWVSLTIALYRPDGVILGCLLTLIGLAFIYHTPSLKKYFISMLLTFSLGIIYFLWRYQYFDFLLPLPLYVKSHAAGHEGIDSNIKWIKDNAHLIILSITLFFLSKKNRPVFFLIIPATVLFIALSFAVLSQNIGNRFQAPLYISIYYVLLVTSCRYLKSENLSPKFILTISLTILIFSGIGITKINKAYKKLTEFNYINQLPSLLSDTLPDNLTIALTEAGRLAYWNQSTHNIIDLVGLNSSYPATHTIDVDYIEQLSPDILMFHHANWINTQEFKKFNGNIFELKNDTKRYLKIQPHFEQALAKVDLASIVSIQFLEKNFMSYDIFLVDYKEDNGFYHIYAFKKSLNFEEKFIDIINKSFNINNKKSYFDLK